MVKERWFRKWAAMKEGWNEWRLRRKITTTLAKIGPNQQRKKAATSEGYDERSTQLWQKTEQTNRYISAKRHFLFLLIYSRFLWYVFLFLSKSELQIKFLTPLILFSYVMFLYFILYWSELQIKFLSPLILSLFLIFIYFTLYHIYFFFLRSELQSYISLLMVRF